MNTIIVKNATHEDIKKVYNWLWDFIDDSMPFLRCVPAAPYFMDILAKHLFNIGVNPDLITETYWGKNDPDKI